MADVDRDYERLAAVVGEFVQKPTTQPWGNRSLLFRDPDGNLINLFTPVTADAVKRHSACCGRRADRPVRRRCEFV